MVQILGATKICVCHILYLDFRSRLSYDLLKRRFIWFGMEPLLHYFLYPMVGFSLLYSSLTDLSYRLWSKAGKAPHDPWSSGLVGSIGRPHVMLCMFVCRVCSCVFPLDVEIAFCVFFALCHSPNVGWYLMFIAFSQFVILEWICPCTLSLRGSPLWGSPPSITITESNISEKYFSGVI